MWHAFVCTGISGREAANGKALCMMRTMQHLHALQFGPIGEATEACKQWWVSPHLVVDI